MRDETPDVGVEIRGVEKLTSNEDEDEYVLRVSVLTANPQSRNRHSELDADGSALVGEIPVTNADLPDVDQRLNAEFVTALEEQVRAYYPLNDGRMVLLTWDAATDEWTSERRELETYSFDPEDVTVFDEESVIWQRVDDGDTISES